MRIDSRTYAAITLETGLSAKAIRDSMSGKTKRESTRLAILGAAKRLGLSQVEACFANVSAVEAVVERTNASKATTASDSPPKPHRSRHRIAPEDLEPVDDATRAKARAILDRHEAKTREEANG